VLSVAVANQQRIRRVADQIRRELSDLISTELKDPRLGLITLTGVEVSSDLAHAKVFFTSLADPARRAETVAGLRRAAGFLRSALGARLALYSVPELRFMYDESVESGMRLARLIDEAVAQEGRRTRPRRRRG
jgi:ribosome-binding factor A